MSRRTLCRAAITLLALLYAAALALYAIGTLGLFGNARDPLAGVYLIPLGLPWNLMIDIFPERLWPWLAAAAPLVNLLLLGTLCRWLRRRG